MESWSRAVLEWVNCLDILDTNVIDLKELEDGQFYAKLIKILSEKEYGDDHDDKDFVSSFIKDTYPEFLSETNETKENCKAIHVASLLLLHSSQEPKLHRPMCMKLSNETQLKIKSFLEKVLEYGSCVTKDNINTAIMETSENFIRTPPATPKMRPLKDFLNSPATTVRKNYNKIMDERTREVRFLKAELETERFEKADLQEDLEIQCQKNYSLQQKLQEKIAEIKKMREESTGCETPQSSKKKKDVKTPKNRVSVKVQELTEEIALLKFEISNLQDEKQSVMRKLASVERSCITFKERSKMNEKNLETLLIQADIKDQEIEELKNHNEQLRAHIQEMRRQTIAEQSFEMEMTGLSVSNGSLNGSEVLSAVIDIQLQEAKEESRVFKSQLDDLHKKLESVQADYQILQQSNKTLETEVNWLQTTKQELSDKYIETSNSFESEKVHFREQTAKFETMFLLKEELLNQSKEQNETLKLHLLDLENNLKTAHNLLNAESTKVRDLEALILEKIEMLQVEKVRYENLNQEHTILKQENINMLEEIENLKNLVSSKEDSLSLAEQHKKELEIDLYNLKGDLNHLQDLLNAENARVKNLETMITEMKLEHVETIKTQLLRYQALEEKCGSLEQENFGLLQKVKDINLTIASNENLLKEYLIKHQNLTCDLQDLNDQLETAQHGLAEEKKRVKELEATVIQVETVNRELTESQSLRYQTIEEKCINLEKDKLSLVKDIEDLNHVISAKEKLLEHNYKESEILKSASQDLNKELFSIQDSLNKERARVKDLESTITLIKQENEEALQTQCISYQALEKIYMNVEKEKMILTTENDHLRSLILSKEQLLERSQQKNEQFESDVRNLSEKLQTVQDLLNAERTRANELESTLIQMESQHEETVQGQILKYKDLERRYINSDKKKVSLLQEHENFIHKIKASESLLIQCGQEKENLISDLQNLNGILQSVQESLAEEKSKVKDLESTIEFIKQDKEECLKMHSVNYQALEKKHMDAEHEKLYLLKGTESLKNFLSSKEQQLQKAQQHITKLDCDLCQFKNELDARTTEVSCLESALTESKLETEKAVQLNKNLHAELNLLKLANHDLCQGKGQLHMQCTELEKEKSHLLEKIKELNEHTSAREELLRQTQQQNETLQLKLARLDKEVKSVQNLLNEKNTRINEFEFAIAHIEQEKTEMFQKHLISYQALEQKYIDVKQDKLQLTNDIEDIKSLLLSKEELLQQLQERSAKLEGDLCNAKNTTESVQDDLNVAIVKVKNLESMLAQTKFKTDQIIQTNENLQDEINFLKSQNCDLHEAKEQLCKQNQGLEQEKTRLLKEFEEFKIQAALKEELLEQSQQQSEAFSSKLKDLEENMKSAQNLLSSKNAWVENLESILAEMECERKESLSIIEKLKLENVEHKNLIQSCTFILTELVRHSSQLTGSEVTNIGDSTILDLSKQLKTLINSIEVIYSTKDSDLENLKTTLSTLTLTISKLENDVTQFKEIKVRDDQIISEYLKEITDLRPIAREKDSLLEDMDKLQKQLSDEKMKMKLVNEEKKLLGRKLLDVKHSVIALKNEKSNLVMQVQTQNQDLLTQIARITEIIVKMQDQIYLDNNIILQLREEQTLLASKYDEEKKARLDLVTKCEILENDNKCQTKEKKELKDKLNTFRVRNAKLEKNLDELRKEKKKLEIEKPSAEEQSKVEELKTSISKLQLQVEELKAEKIELSKRLTEQDFDSRLKEVHTEYDQKLEKIKQKMKTAYSDEIAKVNRDQERLMQEKLNAQRVKMEEQCRKHAEEITKYKDHVTKLSSDYWDVGEKLLVEKQQKENMLQQLQDLRMRLQYERTIAAKNSSQPVPTTRSKTSSLDRREFVTTTRDEASTSRTVQTIKEEITTCARRESIQSVQTMQGMGNAFKVEDEEGEVFNTNYLADMKAGRCSVAPDLERLSVLQMRNAQCKPHLKSSYPAETQFQPETFTEEEIKSGSAIEDVFNDSLSQSLLPGEKTKKRDRTQTLYKRPGPPTPSKNGGRLSLQGNESRSPNSRILRERNVERRSTATPRRLKDLFGGSSRRQDENVSGTPKGRRLSSIFRKPK